MGIKGWIFTGLALAVGAAYVLGKLMKEDESAKKVERIIRDVDNKDDKKEEEGDSVEKMSNELTEAMKDLELDKDSSDEWLGTTFANADENLIEVAIKDQDFTQMYNLFEQRYNPYPVQMSRATAFAEAKAEGFISEELFEKAREFFGDLWSYVGD